MKMGSSIPNFTRKAARTSGGTLELVASSPKGSPGASASSTNRIRLMPSRLGTAMIRRRRMYFPIVVLPSPVQLFRTADLTSGLAVPVRDLPQIVVPAAERRRQVAGDGRGLRAAQQRLDVIVCHDEVIELDVHRGAFDGVELLVG